MKNTKATENIQVMFLFFMFYQRLILANLIAFPHIAHYYFNFTSVEHGNMIKGINCFS